MIPDKLQACWAQLKDTIKKYINFNNRSGLINQTTTIIAILKNFKLIYY
jgi:hypothetical protein